MKEYMINRYLTNPVSKEEQFKFFDKPYANLVINLLIIPEFIYLSKIVSLISVFNSYFKRVDGNVQLKLITCLFIIFVMFFFHGYFIKSVKYAKRVTFLQNEIKTITVNTLKEKSIEVSPTLEEIIKEGEE